MVFLEIYKIINTVTLRNVVCKNQEVEKKSCLVELKLYILKTIYLLKAIDQREKVFEVK